MTPAPNSSVLGGMLAHVSASQIKNHVECKRSWYANKVLGLEQAATDNLNLGTELHSQVEDHLLRMIFPDYPSVAKLLDLPNFPRLSSKQNADGHVAYQHVEWPSDYGLKVRAAQVRVKGRMDLLHMSAEGLPTIYDWKSTSSISSYAKTPEELERDVQLNIYGMEVINQFNAKHVRFAHGYMQTHKNKSEPAPKGFKGKAKIVITDPIPAESIRTFFQTVIEPAVEDMKASARAENILALDAGWGHCNAYNKKCPYWNLCTDRKSTGFFDEATPTTEEEKMTLKEKMEERRKATQSSPVVGTATAEPPKTSEALSGLATALAQGINPPDAAKPDVLPKYEPMSPDVAAVAEEVVKAAQAFVNFDAPPPVPEGLTLYVDCIPTWGMDTPPDLGNRVSSVGKEIAARFGVRDVREVEFGKGTAALVAWFLNNIPDGAWTCSSVGLSGIVVEALAPHAATVIRGLR